MELLNGEKRSRNRGPPPSWGRRPRDEIGGVLHFGAYLQDGEASPATGAGPFLEIGEERDHCPGREITSRLDLSLGLVANLGQMKVCKGSGVQK